MPWLDELDPPLALTANTDNCFSRWVLWHDGHASTVC